MPGLADSKLLTPAARDRVLRRGRSRRAAAWSVVVVPAREVDRIGLHVCNVEGMRRALAQLAVTPSYVLTDGFPVRGAAGAGSRGLEGRPGQRVDRRRVGAGQGHPGPDHGGLHEQFPPYDFLGHKGYVTPVHDAALDAHGPCAEHRFSYVNVARRVPGDERVPARTVARLDEGPVRDDEVVDVTAVDYVVDAADTEVLTRMSAEDLEKYETEMELQLYREYRDVVGLFAYVVETERRFYLTNAVEVTPRSTDGGEVYFEVTMSDAWVWDMYRPARFVKNVRVLTFKDVNVEELARQELSVELPE